MLYFLYGAEVGFQGPVLELYAVAGPFLDLQFCDEHIAVLVPSGFDYNLIAFYDLDGFRINSLAERKCVIAYAIAVDINFYQCFTGLLINDNRDDYAYHFVLRAIAGKCHPGGEEPHQECEDQSDAECGSFLHDCLLFIVLDEFE